MSGTKYRNEVQDSAFYKVDWNSSVCCTPALINALGALSLVQSGIQAHDVRMQIMSAIGKFHSCFHAAAKTVSMVGGRSKIIPGLGKEVLQATQHDPEEIAPHLPYQFDSIQRETEEILKDLKEVRVEFRTWADELSRAKNGLDDTANKNVTGSLDEASMHVERLHAWFAGLEALSQSQLAARLEDLRGHVAALSRGAPDAKVAVTKIRLAMAQIMAFTEGVLRVSVESWDVMDGQVTQEGLRMLDQVMSAGEQRYAENLKRWAENSKSRAAQTGARGRQSLEENLEKQEKKINGWEAQW